MSKTVSYFRNKIITLPARSKWRTGVIGYAQEIFDRYIEVNNLTENDTIPRKITELDLLIGAPDWECYSRGGSTEVVDYEICQRLCSEEMMKRTEYGELPPKRNMDWLGYQAKALREASEIIINMINREFIRKR